MRGIEAPTKIVYHAASLHLISIWLLLILFVSIVYLWCVYKERLVFKLRPLLIIAGTFCFTTFYVYFWDLDYILLAFEYGLGISLSLLNPVVAVGFLSANLFLRPWELMPPNIAMQVMPRTLALIALASWLLHLLVNKEIKIVWNRFSTTYTFFIIWIFISAFFAYNTEDSMEYIFKALFPVTVVVFLILNCVTTKLDVRIILNVTYLAIIGVIINAIYFSITWHGIIGSGGRLNGLGLWGNSNDLAALIVLILPVIAYCYFIKTKEAFSWLTGLAFGAPLFLGLMLSQSRGAILSLGACGLFYVVMCMKGIFKRFFTLIVIVIVPVILFLTIDREAGELSTSTEARLNYYTTGFRMLKQHLVFGVGPGNYPAYYERYTTIYHETGERTAHSSWLLILAEAGPIGFALFISLFLITFKKAWQIRENNPEFILALISYSVAISFLSHTYLISPYLIFAIILAASRVHADSIEGKMLENTNYEIKGVSVTASP